MTRFVVNAIPDLFFALGAWLALAAIWQGFAPHASPGLAVLEGLTSSVFWLSAAGLPMYWKAAADNERWMNALNCVAAGATGGAVMASVDAGLHAARVYLHLA